MEDMADLAVKPKKMGFQLEQGQDLTPPPMTDAAVIYYAGNPPYTLKEVYTPKNKKDKLNQRKFFFWYKRENQEWIRKALKEMGKGEWVPVLLGK
jgi:radical SAM superfamily enzyme YgiQ (UPF0313 family)